MDDDTRQHRWSLIHHSAQANEKVDVDGRTVVEEVSIFAPTKQKCKILKYNPVTSTNGDGVVMVSAGERKRDEVAH